MPNSDSPSDSSSRSVGGSVIVGVDGTESTLRAVEWAALFAERTSSRLVLLHVVGRGLWNFVASVSLMPDRAAEALRADIDAQLDAAEKVATTTAPRLAVERRIVEGRVVETYLAEVGGARLLVLDAHDEPGGSILHGHVPGIIAGATCPVLLWRTPAGPGRDTPELDTQHRDTQDREAAGSIVVGVDESEASANALDVAFATADALRVPVTVAHMWETDAAVGLGYAAGPTDWELVRVLRAEQEAQISDFLAPLVRKYRRVTVRTVLSENNPAKGLVELSRSAALVVVGRTGRGRVAEALFGSVTQNVVHHAHCPVLVVPAPVAAPRI